MVTLLKYFSENIMTISSMYSYSYISPYHLIFTLFKWNESCLIMHRKLTHKIYIYVSKYILRFVLEKNC